MSLELVIRSIFSTFFLASVIRICTPIILPAMGGLFATAAGTFNMALEGIMLWGAFTGVFVSAYTGNVWLAVLCGVIVGILVSLILAVFHLEFGADLVLAGLAINLFSSGGTVFLMYTFTGEKGNTTGLPSLSVPNVNIPFIKDIPVLGQILSGHPVFTYLAFFLVFPALCNNLPGKLVGDNARLRKEGLVSPNVVSVPVGVDRIFYGLISDRFYLLDHFLGN